MSIQMLFAHKAVRYALAGVWLFNGLYCKILNQVPRHEAIVAAILGERHAGLLTKSIGVGEIGIALWILSAWRYRWCAVTQMALIAAMNAIEFILVPDLLLWGRYNILFASGLVAIIYANAFAKGAR